MTTEETVNANLRKMRQLVIDKKWTKHTYKSPLDGKMCLWGMSIHELREESGATMGKLSRALPVHFRGDIVGFNDSSMTNEQDVIEALNKAMEA